MSVVNYHESWVVVQALKALGVAHDTSFYSPNFRLNGVY